MKKLILLMLSFLLLGSIMLKAQYYDGYDEDYNNDQYYGDEYENNDQYYDYGYENAEPYLSNYQGSLYYWVHPYENLYFVIAGGRIFIIPYYQIRRIRGIYSWHLLSINDFIYHSCFGMHYYDSYRRFYYYNNYFYRHHYSYYNCRWLRRNYRSYYRNRRRSRNYYRHYNSVMRNHRANRGYSSRSRLSSSGAKGSLYKRKRDSSLARKAKPLNRSSAYSRSGKSSSGVRINRNSSKKRYISKSNSRIIKKSPRSFSSVKRSNVDRPKSYRVPRSSSVSKSYSRPRSDNRVFRSKSYKSSRSYKAPKSVSRTRSYSRPKSSSRVSRSKSYKSSKSAVRRSSSGKSSKSRVKRSSSRSSKSGRRR